MKAWLKFFSFHVLYFIAVGAVGGLVWIWALREYRESQGMMAGDQVKHAVQVLEMMPNEFYKMKRLLNANRLPIDEREKEHFADRDRFREERKMFETKVLDWDALREETLSRIREKMKEVDAARTDVDARMQVLKDKEAAIKFMADRIVTEQYKIWISMVNKMEPVDVANSIKDRDAKEIVQDLRQLKAVKSAEVFKALREIANTIEDITERDDYIIKMNDVTMLLRAGGLR